MSTTRIHMNGGEHYTSEEQRNCFTQYFEDMSVPKDDGFDACCIFGPRKCAGYHSAVRAMEYRSLCAQACKKATELLNSGISALEVIAMVMQCLEDSVVTNAGVGSNLTLGGTVECDASLMDGQTLHFGAVGAVSDIKNPILVAKKLVDVQKDGNLSVGRIPPCIMVGRGASVWAKENGIDPVPTQTLESESARSMFENHKRRLEMADGRIQLKKRRKHRENSSNKAVHVADEEKPPEDGVQDTVGAVCVDTGGNLAAGCSSGGVSLKQPGRLGPAAVYGAGCWAHNWRSADKPGVAVATSGTGEHLIKTLLAKECAEHMQSEEFPPRALQIVLKDNFLESEYLRDTAAKFGGVLAVRLDQTDHKSVELVWGHTTSSMCLGYMRTSDKKPKTLISRLEDGKLPGKTFCCQGKHFRL